MKKIVVDVAISAQKILGVISAVVFVPPLGYGAMVNASFQDLTTQTADTAGMCVR
jgi:hypothetical protein